MPSGLDADGKRTISKTSIGSAVVEYLKEVGVEEDLVKKVQSDLNALDPAAPIPECLLSRLFQYALDGTFEVAVSRLSGQTDRFEVRQWTSVQDLKAEIESRLNIPLGEQVLLRNGQELKALDECLAAFRVTLSNASLELVRVVPQNVPEATPTLEVILKAADGIPEGSIVSLRAGTKGRQAPLRFDHPMRFPISKENANPFKIDIFSQFGKARVALRAGESRYVAEVERPDGGVVGTVEFEALDGSERERHYKHATAAPPTSMSRRTQKSVQASRYLDEHGLLPYMQGVIQSVLHEKPDDPYEYIIRQMQAPRRSSESSASVRSTDSEAAAEAQLAELREQVQALTSENQALKERLKRLEALVPPEALVALSAGGADAEADPGEVTAGNAADQMASKTEASLGEQTKDAVLEKDGDVAVPPAETLEAGALPATAAPSPELASGSHEGPALPAADA